MGNKIGDLVLKRIQLYERYKKLCAEYSTKDYLETQDKKKVLTILKELGYSSKYVTGERFFQIKEVKSEFEFYFHLSLRYGVTDIIFGGTYLESDYYLGGPVHHLWKVLHSERGGDYDETLVKPAFSNYNELREILNKAFKLYEDFKIEFKAALI